MKGNNVQETVSKYNVQYVSVSLQFFVMEKVLAKHIGVQHLVTLVMLSITS